MVDQEMSRHACRIAPLVAPRSQFAALAPGRAGDAALQEAANDHGHDQEDGDRGMNADRVEKQAFVAENRADSIGPVHGPSFENGERVTGMRRRGQAEAAAATPGTRLCESPGQRAAAVRGRPGDSQCLVPGLWEVFRICASLPIGTGDV